MSDPAGIGLGAGGGAIAGAVVYALDRAFGSGRAVKSLDRNFKELRDDIAALSKLFGETSERVARLFDWHSVTDPDDPAGKIWYFSVATRKLLTTMQAGVDRLLELIGELIQRFDKYNATMERLIDVVEQLQQNVNGLGVIVSGLDRRLK